MIEAGVHKSYLPTQSQPLTKIHIILIPVSTVDTLIRRQLKMIRGLGDFQNINVLILRISESTKLCITPSFLFLGDKKHNIALFNKYNCIV